MAARGILENPAMYSGHSITPKQESISHSSIKFYQSINQYLCSYKFSLHCSKLYLEIGKTLQKKKFYRQTFVKLYFPSVFPQFDLGWFSQMWIFIELSQPCSEFHTSVASCIANCSSLLYIFDY